MNKPFKLIAIALSLLLATSQMSCDEDVCDDVACTLVLIQLSVTVTDENQDPVELDSFEVINLDTNENITVSLLPEELEEWLRQGRYPLVEDGSIGINLEQEIQFRGFIDTQEVIRSNYIVSSDCCHISLVSGDVDLTL